MLHCDQCGIRGQLYRIAGGHCPNHALPEPYSSCDGKLVETGSCSVCDDEQWLYLNWEDKSWRPGRMRLHHLDGRIEELPENDYNKPCPKCNGDLV